jgi:hypothetical protein
MATESEFGSEEIPAWEGSDWRANAREMEATQASLDASGAAPKETEIDEGDSAEDVLVVPPSPKQESAKPEEAEVIEGEIVERDEVKPAFWQQSPPVSEAATKQLEAMRAEVLRDPDISDADRKVLGGENTQVDGALLLASQIAIKTRLEVVEKEMEESKPAVVESQKDIAPARAHAEAVVAKIQENPAVTRDLIVNGDPQKGGAWDVFINTDPRKQAAELPRKQGREEFFNGLRWTPEERDEYWENVYSREENEPRGGIRKRMADAAMYKGPINERARQKSEDKRLEIVEGRYDSLMRLGQPVKALDEVRRFIAQQQKMFAGTKDAADSVDPLLEDASFMGLTQTHVASGHEERIRAFTILEYGITHQTKGAKAADETLLKNSEVIFATRDQVREQAELAAAEERDRIALQINEEPHHVEDYIAGKRSPELSEDVLRDRAQLAALRARFAVLHEKLDITQVVTQLMDEIIRKETAADYFKDPAVYHMGEQPLLASEIAGLVEGATMVYRALAQRDRVAAERIATAASQEITERILSHTAYWAKKNDPYQFLARTGLPFDPAAISRLSVDDISEMRKQLEQRISEEAGPSGVADPLSLAYLKELRDIESAMLNDQSGAIEQLRLVAIEASAREKRAEYFNQGNALIINGAVDPADGVTGTLTALLVMSGAFPAVDVYGARAWKGVNMPGQPGATPVNQLDMLYDDRTWSTIYIEGKAPPTVTRRLILEQQDPGGEVGFSVNLNPSLAKVVRVIDPEGYAGSSLPTLLRESPEDIDVESLKNSPHFGKFNWVLMPTKLCRVSPEKGGRITINYGHVRGPIDEKEVTLIVYKKNDDGTPSASYIETKKVAEEYKRQREQQQLVPQD